jgi:hypothetical protein
MIYTRSRMLFQSIFDDFRGFFRLSSRELESLALASSSQVDS